MNKAVYKKPWFVYIAECGDKSLYTGIARDASKRIDEHNRTNKCKYTRSRKPVKLLYSEKHTDFSSAAKREAEIKKFPRKKKLKLITKE